MGTWTQEERGTVRFVTVEERCLKFWRFAQEGLLSTTKRVHVKQDLLSACANELTGLLVVLGRNGGVLILDSNGGFMSTI